MKTADEIADAVWRRLTGMFGGDALVRKFGEVPTPEWVAMIGRLQQHEVERGLRRLAYSGAMGVPSLPQFIRLCREVATDLDRDLPPIQPRGALPPPPPAKRWESIAGVHLLAYLWGRSAARNALTGRPEVMAILVEAKNLWAEQMREWDAHGQRPRDNGRELWREMMMGAEISIDLMAPQGAAA